MRNIKKEWYIIAILFIALLVQWKCSKECDPIETKTTVTRTVRVKEENDTVSSTKLAVSKPIYIVRYKDKVVEVPVDYKPEAGQTVVEVRKYNDTAVLKNGTIRAEILAEGKVHKVTYNLTTHDSIIQETIKTESVIERSALFFTAGNTVSTELRINNVEAGLMYARKKDWLAGVNLQYDTRPEVPKGKRTGVGIKVGVRIK